MGIQGPLYLANDRLPPARPLRRYTVQDRGRAALLQLRPTEARRPSLCSRRWSRGDGGACHISLMYRVREGASQRKYEGHSYCNTHLLKTSERLATGEKEREREERLKGGGVIDGQMYGEGKLRSALLITLWPFF